MTLEILDSAGKLVRAFRSDDKPVTWPKDRDIPDYWIRPEQVLSKSAGLHRFVWDLHYAPPLSQSASYPISAVYANTWLEPRGPWAHPGTYTARLTANGKTMEQKFVVKLDPRVKATTAAMQSQFDLSMRAYAGMNEAMKTLDAVHATRKVVTEAASRETNAEKKKAIEAENAKLQAFDQAGFARFNQQLGQILDQLQDSDDAPTTQLRAAFEERSKALNDLLAAWPKADAAARAAIR